MKIIDLPEPFAVVCHDAGAANHIFSWIAGEHANCRLHLDGPAKALWEARGVASSIVRDMNECLDGAGAVLTGTGWASDLEHQARSRARDLGLRSVAVIDHWVNYPQRFCRDGAVVLPDEIWVTDAWALAIAANSFEMVPVRQKPNVYLDTLVDAISPCADASNDVLVVMEPARTDWERGVPGEFQALDYLMRRREALQIPLGGCFRLRPHPSDPPGKYASWLEQNRGLPILMDESTSLEQGISRCRSVVGMQSYALVVALAAGRRVFSCLPPWGPRLALPHPGIIEIRHISEAL